MKPFFRLLLLLAAAVAVRAADPATFAPAINWSTALFTRDNFHSMTLRGSRASFPSTKQVDVVDLNLTIFSGDATNRIETIILSTAATFLPKDNLASGNQGVRVIRNDLEATGTQWTYDNIQKKVSLQGRVRVIFNAELKSILK